MSSINLTIENNIATLQMLGEGKFNASLLDEFNQALDQIEQYSDNLVLIITGEGKNFSHGYDLEYLGAHSDTAKEFTDRTMQLVARLLKFSVPTMAMINGHAFGLGAMVAIACDFRCMREDRGYFCLPEIDLQMTLLPGMNALLKHKLPEASYREALLTGKRYGGTEAKERAFVDFCAKEEVLTSQAQAAMVALANKDRKTYAALKTELYSEILEVIKTYHC